MTQSLFAFATALLLTITAFGQATLESARLNADSKRLDALEKAFTGGFDKHYWDASKRLADERGVEIIHAVMMRSRKWQDEEGLLFVPLVALLPRIPALTIIHKYQKSHRESDRLYAGEFIVEFDMSDTKQAVQLYNKK